MGRDHEDWRALPLTGEVMLRWVVQRVTMAPRAGFLAKLAEPAFQWAAVRYKAAVGAELKKYGLRYDDLLDPTMNLVRQP